MVAIRVPAAITVRASLASELADTIRNLQVVGDDRCDPVLMEVIGASLEPRPCTLLYV